MEPLPGLSKEAWQTAKLIEGFTSQYLLARYDEPAPIPFVHLEMWALFMSDYKLVSAAAPREHAKSTAITFALVLFLVCFRMTRHMLLIGSNEKLASQFLIDIAYEVNENEELRNDFGIDRFQKETETELILRFRDGTATRLIAKGAQQRMRGIKWHNKRPDHVFFDDMEDDEMVLNEQTRDKFLDWMQSAVIPAGSKNARVRGVGTIIGFGSFLEGTMPDPKDPDTVVEPLRIYSKKRTPGDWVSVKYKAHPGIGDFSELLWGEQFNEQWFLDKRASFQRTGKLDKYAQEYLNDPIDPDTAYYRKSDLLPMKPGDHETKKTYYASADLAIGEKERNAYSVLIVGGVDAEGMLHIVDVRRDRWDGLEIIDEMISVQERWAPEVFKLESENIAKSLGSILNREMSDRSVWINIDDESPTKDKDKRGRAMQARTRAGKVKFDKEADWWPDLEEELIRYPKYQYKDQFDALAWLGLIVDDMINPMTDEEQEEEDYEEQVFLHMPKGICATTGY